jgi:hypothetical protein
MKKTLLSSALLALLAGALAAGPAYGSPRLWTDSTETTLLRSVKTPPVNQPDALEFVNEGPIGLVLFNQGAVTTITCSEIEFGTTVVANNELNSAGMGETKLALPFGVAEGDDCTTMNTAGQLESAPVYFDTNAAGVVPANIALSGPPFEATLRKLKLSLNVAGSFCTANLEGAKGPVFNATAGFVEESPPNLVMATNAIVPATCSGKKAKLEIKARYFLETMSTTTDTAFIGP